MDGPGVSGAHFSDSFSLVLCPRCFVALMLAVQQRRPMQSQKPTLADDPRSLSAALPRRLTACSQGAGGAGGRA